MKMQVANLKKFFIRASHFSFLSLVGCLSNHPIEGASYPAPSGISSKFFATPELKNHSEEPLVIQHANLWEVRWGSLRSYIFGTVHLGQSAYGAVPRSVISALESADVFVSEMYAGPAGLHDISMFIQKGQGNNRTLFAPAVWKKIVLMSGVAEEDLNRTSLANIYLLLAQDGTSNSSGTPFDIYLLILAQGFQKKRLYLETPEEQFRVLNSVFTPEVITRLVNEAGGSKQRAESTTRNLLQAYISGDENRMTSAIYNDADSQILGAQGMNALFRQRNRTWVNAMTNQLKSTRTFVAVGVGHLVGPDNFLTLLKNAGFEVSRL